MSAGLAQWLMVNTTILSQLRRYTENTLYSIHNSPEMGIGRIMPNSQIPNLPIVSSLSQRYSTYFSIY